MPAEENLWADFLSRIYDVEDIQMVEEENELKASVDKEQMLMRQKADEACRHMYKRVKYGDVPTDQQMKKSAHRFSSAGTCLTSQS